MAPSLVSEPAQSLSDASWHPNIHENNARTRIWGTYKRLGISFDGVNIEPSGNEGGLRVVADLKSLPPTTPTTTAATIPIGNPFKNCLRV